MRATKPVFFQKVTVVFGPDETKKILEKYGEWRCIHMKPRTDLKPWGTREALMERRVGTAKVMVNRMLKGKSRLTKRGQKVK